MIDDTGDFAAFYDGDPGREQRRLTEHQLEFDLTWRYLTQSLPSQGSILEVELPREGIRWKWQDEVICSLQSASRRRCLRNAGKPSQSKGWRVGFDWSWPMRAISEG